MAEEQVSDKPIEKPKATQDFQQKDRYTFASEKPRRKIFVDNLIGGLAWGVGSIIGATIIVGIFGFLIARFRQIPLVGDVVQVIVDEIDQGRNSDLFNKNPTPTPAPTPVAPEVPPPASPEPTPVSYP